MTEQGNRLTQCIAAVAAYGKEIETLRKQLNDLLATELGWGGLSYMVCGNPVDASDTDEAGWVYTDIARSTPLKRARRGRPSKSPDFYLSYQISLYGAGIAFPGNNEPLLHVFLWRSPVDLRNSRMGYPVSSEYARVLKHGRLIVWEQELGIWTDAEWVFSLRLLSLDSSQALLERIVRPALALMSLESDEGILNALPDDLPGLVVYPREDVLDACEERQEEW